MKNTNGKIPLPSDYISNFLNFIKGVDMDYVDALDGLNVQDKLTQDYLHSLELDNLKCAERSKIATKLAQNRKERRYYKDKIEIYQPIIDFLDDDKNKKVSRKLEQVLGQVRKQEKIHKNRFYIPRVLKEE